MAVAELFACFGCSDILVAEPAGLAMVNWPLFPYGFRYQISLSPFLRLGGGELYQLSVDEQTSEAAFIASCPELQVDSVFVEYVQGFSSASGAEVTGGLFQPIHQPQ